MTAKGNLLRSLRTLSSGTIASLIGSDRYSVIDRASSTAIMYAAALPEEECKQYQTFEDICRLFKLANGK